MKRIEDLKVTQDEALLKVEITFPKYTQLIRVDRKLDTAKLEKVLKEKFKDNDFLRDGLRDFKECLNIIAIGTIQNYKE